MHIRLNIRRFLFALICLGSPGAVWAELPVDQIPRVLTLPASYPDSWIFAHDMNFFSLIDGKVVVLDVAAGTRNYKGQIGAGQFASFIEAESRSELYVAETFYPRRLSGERTDVVTIYNKADLKVIDEIVLPGGKRSQAVSLKNALQLLDDERLLLVFNFTPAASVTVIDIVNRKILEEVDIPGCSLIYPAGKLAFSTFCSDGALLTTRLTKDGQVKSQERSQVFIDIENEPLFTKAGIVDGVNYFPSFQGNIQPIDFSKGKPLIKSPWSLLDNEDRNQNWRPGGWQIISAHPDGLLFLLMHKDGYNGSHKDGGSEVWVFDVSTRKRIKRLILDTWGVSIEVTSGKKSYLAVTNANFDIDVYDSGSGEKLRTIGGRATESPFTLHAVK